MASVTLPDEDPYNFRSDGKPGVDGYIGDFRKGPAVFTLYTLGSDPGRAERVTDYLLDVDDGAGQRECCRFTDESDAVAEWAPTWQGDPWCPDLLKRCQALIEEHRKGGEDSALWRPSA
jgi:hypothetical protein